MGDASYVQSSFLGGEWSPYYQGRYDHPKYRTALKLCRNALPIEEGASVRRGGTAFMATTRRGVAGRVISFDIEATNPFQIELTDGHLRLYAGNSLVFTPDVQSVAALNTANPVKVSVGNTVTWASQDSVQFFFNGGNTTSNAAILRNRQFVITSVDGQNFTLTDPITGATIDGSTIGWDPTQLTLQVGRVLDFATPYTNGMWQQVRRVQDETTAVLLHGSVSPRALSITASASSNQFATFSFNPITFLDGPYLDPVDGSQATPSALSGVITVSVAWQTWSVSVTYGLSTIVTYLGQDYQSLVAGNTGNTPTTSPTKWKAINAGSAVGAQGFVTTDVGRLIRLFSEPLAWSKTTVYAVGDSVKYGGIYYTMVTLPQHVNRTPTLFPQFWAINPSAAIWTWGRITAVQSPSVVSVQVLGDPLLYTSVINVWRLGAYSDTSGYPTCGTFHEGRLWLSGAIKNRIDGSVANGDVLSGTWNFAPTETDGTVADEDAISYTFRAPDKSVVLWMEPDHAGIICGTLKGEWLVQASQLNDPLTPTSIQAHRVTKYGCAAIAPVRTGLTLAFVEGFQRKVLEYFPDVFTGRFTAPNLTEAAKHMTKTGVQEIAYQRELTPVIWGRTGDGRLIGCTYKREALMSSQPANFTGWHQHTLGSGRVVESISVGPRPDGVVDQLWAVTNDPLTNVRHVEVMQDLFDQGNTIYQAWFLDDAGTPSGSTQNGTSVTFYGLWHLNGKKVTVFVGGLDLGDWVVANGSVTVPFGLNPLFTKSYLDHLSAQGINFGGLATAIDTVTVVPPAPPITGASANGWDLGYIGTLGVVNDSTTPAALPDWANNKLYVHESALSGSSPSSWRTFNLATGAEIAENLAVDGDTNSQAVLGYDGNLFVCTNGNYNVLYKINPLTMVTISSFGIAHGFNGSDLSNTVPQPNSLTPISAFANFLLAVGGISDSASVINTDRMTFGGSVFNFNSAADRTGRYGCPGLSSNDGAGNYLGTAYMVWNDGSIFGSPQVNLYRWSIRHETQLAVGPGGGLLGYLTGGFSGTPSIPYPIGADSWGASVGVWDPAINYRSGDVVEQDQSDPVLGVFTGKTFFVSLLDGNQGNVPFVLQNMAPSIYTTWRPLGASQNAGATSPLGTDQNWDVAKTYYNGDVVLYNHTTTASNIDGNVGNTPGNEGTSFRWQFVPNGWIKTQLVKAILPSAVDASWTTMNCNGLCYDQVDNGIILHLGCGDPVLQQRYIVKVSGADGSVLWKVPVTSTPFDVVSMTNSRLQTGVYAFLASLSVAGVHTIYVINSLTGAYTTQTVKGIGPDAGQFFDNVGGLIYLVADYTQSTGTPAPVNLTPASYTSKWTAFWPANGTGNNVFQGTTTAKSRDTVPVVIGFTFASQWQLLRPNSQQEAGAVNGPAFGKKRRSPQYAAQFDGTGVGGDLRVGTDFVNMRPVNFNSDGEVKPVANTLYSGIVWDNLDDDYTFNSELALQITRPFPVNLTAFGAYPNTQDK